MLWFVGLGISGSLSIPNEAMKVLSKADIVYMEQFTSPLDTADIERIKKMTNGSFLPAKRWMVEDGSRILSDAKNQNVVLLSYGDPYIATTHAELRSRAMREKIETRSIHASSSLTSMIGQCGLHFYKIGRIATVMSDVQSLTTPYYVIYRNLVEGNHTILLLEYNQDAAFFLDPRDALESLLCAEDGQRRNVISSSTFAIVASRIGLPDQAVLCGMVSTLLDTNFGAPPHAIIIPGNLHFTEEDALKLFATCLDGPKNNSENIKKISVQMMEKYVPMVRKALDDVRPYYGSNKQYDVILENAELYIRDAEKFLQDGQDEVAILSIGYADGLVDALRLARGLDPTM